MKLNDVKVGDKLRAAAGFTCLRSGTIVEVKDDPRRGHGKYVLCGFGRHYLDGQLAFDSSGELVGLTRASPEPVQ